MGRQTDEVGEFFCGYIRRHAPHTRTGVLQRCPQTQTKQGGEQGNGELLERSIEGVLDAAPKYAALAIEHEGGRRGCGDSLDAYRRERNIVGVDAAPFQTALDLEAELLGVIPAEVVVRADEVEVV